VRSGLLGPYSAANSSSLEASRSHFEYRTLACAGGPGPPVSKDTLRVPTIMLNINPSLKKILTINSYDKMGGWAILMKGVYSAACVHSNLIVAQKWG
jgi:hypothetical protein